MRELWRHVRHYAPRAFAAAVICHAAAHIAVWVGTGQVFAGGGGMLGLILQLPTLILWNVIDPLPPLPPGDMPRDLWEAFNGDDIAGQLAVQDVRHINGRLWFRDRQANCLWRIKEPTRCGIRMAEATGVMRALAGAAPVADRRPGWSKGRTRPDGRTAHGRFPGYRHPAGPDGAGGE